MARKRPETIAKELVSGVDDQWQADALELAMNVVFMRAKIKETRETMADEPLVVPYENGPNQSGVRENPIYKSYEALLKTYRATLIDLREVVGNTAGSGEGGTIQDLMAEAMGFKLPAKSK